MAIGIERGDSSAHFQAVDAGQQEIKQNEVGNSVLELLQGVLATGVGDDIVSAGLEDLGEQPTVRVIALNDQNALSALASG